MIDGQQTTQEFLACEVMRANGREPLISGPRIISNHLLTNPREIPKCQEQ